jgi:hypothetical protein
LFWPFQECAHIFFSVSVGVHITFMDLSRVHNFLRLNFMSVQFFIIAAQVCTVFSALPPQIPRSGFWGPSPGWRFLLLESCHTHSTNVFTNYWRSRAALRAEKAAPSRRPGRFEARPCGAVPRQLTRKPGPAASSRASRGPAQRPRPAAVEARSGGNLPGWSRPGPAALSKCNWSESGQWGAATPCAIVVTFQDWL